MTPKEKYELYQRLEKFLDKPEVQSKMVDIFTEEFLRNIPDIRDITLGNKENYCYDVSNRFIRPLRRLTYF